MATKLEKVLELLVNEQQEKASELLHEWFVDNARKIHNELMEEEDDALEGDDLEDTEEELNEADEDGEEIESEEYYSDGDVGEETEDDVDSEEATDDLEGDLGTEDSEEDVDAGVESEDEEADVVDRLDDLEAELAALKADFDALNDTEESEHGEDFNGDGEIAGEMDESAGGKYTLGGHSYDSLEDLADAVVDEKFSDMLADGTPESELELDVPREADINCPDELKNDEAGYDRFMDALTDAVERWKSEKGGSDLDEDIFDDLEESVLDTLQPIKNTNTHSEVGTGGKVSEQDSSPIPQRKVGDRLRAEPVKVKSSEHKGYDRETPPSKKEGTGAKNPTNVKKSTMDGRTSVSKEGDKSALLNKTEGSEGNKMSPLSKMGTKNLTK